MYCGALSSADKQPYGFTYDGLNRLTLGDHKSYTTAWVDNNKFEEKSLAYDLNGNIKRLIRTDNVSAPSADYKYTKGNQLNQINALKAYAYDKNGNTALDGLREITIGYNILNLPKTTSKGSDIITYIYSAECEKLVKRMKDNTYQYYAGNMVYKNDKSLNYLLFDEGLVTKTSSVYSFDYHLKDHPGNSRVTFQSNGTTTTTQKTIKYYLTKPFKNK